MDKKTIKTVNIIDILLSLSILLLSIFPLFGTNGIIVQKITLWLSIIIGGFFIIFNKKNVINNFCIFYALYIIFSIISIFWAYENSGAYTRIIDMIRSWLFIVVLLSSTQDDNKLMKYFDVYLAGVVIISVFCIFKDFNSIKVWARLGSKIFQEAGQNQIYYSCILIYATIYSIYKFIIGNDNKKIVYLFISIFLYICGLLTAVRKCLIIPVIFIVLFTILNNKKNIVKLIFYTIFVFIIIGIIYMLLEKFFPSMSYRVANMVHNIFNDSGFTTIDNSIKSRKILRQLAFSTFLAHPILGVGIGQFRYYAATIGLDLYAHNNFLEILANTGIIGFIIYYLPYLLILYNAFKYKDNNISTQNNFIIAFILSMLAMEYGQVDYYQLYFIIYIAIFSSLTSKKIYHIV